MKSKRFKITVCALKRVIFSGVIEAPLDESVPFVSEQERKLYEEIFLIEKVLNGNRESPVRCHIEEVE